MTTASVSGDELAEFLRDPPRALTAVEVTSSPPSWPPLKPLLVRLVRSYRERGVAPPVFGGVPLCLFGSEWSGFPSRPRTTPARGRCTACAAERSCGFIDEVPDALLPLSAAAPLERWRQYATAFHQVTGSDAASRATPFLERILAAYPGPVSLEPSVLLSDGVQPVARFVVFPHRIATGADGVDDHRTVLACVRRLLADIGAAPCDDLLVALAALHPLPVPVGIEAHEHASRIKLYLRLESATLAEKQAALDALARGGASLDPVPVADLHMIGLVLDAGGLHTVKAYVVADPTRQGGNGFPPPLPVEHPLVSLAGDRALATLDVWCRGTRRANKWDLNVRDHHLAGACAERLVQQLGSSADAVRPLLAGVSYRADVVAVGLRGTTVALYLELN